MNCVRLEIELYLQTQHRTRDGIRTDGQERVVYCYCAETGTLMQRPSKEVYTMGDPHEGPANPQYVNRNTALERRHDGLDSIARGMVGMMIRELEGRGTGVEGTTVSPSPVSLKTNRRYLNFLRKYLFVTYYRQLSIGFTSFQNDHPENTKSQEWMEECRAQNKILGSPQNAWLQILYYYLEHSHNDMVENGNKFGQNTRAQHFARAPQDRDPPIEFDLNRDDWKCLGYYVQMQMFLVIWEAAPGEEFVVSDNSFGLCEGRTSHGGPLHKFFIVSPKIALVLCHGTLRDDDPAPTFFGDMNSLRLRSNNSMLLTAPHRGCIVKYANTTPSPFTVYTGPGIITPCLEDGFEIEITRLSSRDTHTINAIILANLPANGKLTFGSRDAVLRTLTHFNANPIFSAYTKLKFAPLVRLLTPENIPQTIRTRYEASRRSPPGTLWVASLEIYYRLQVGTDGDCLRFRKWERLYIMAWPEGMVPEKPARFVNTMGDHIAKSLFNMCASRMAQLSTDLRDERIFSEQLIIAFLQHMFMRNTAIFKELERQVAGWPGSNGIVEYLDVLLARFLCFGVCEHG